MKQQLEELNQYLLDIQLKTNTEYLNEWSYNYADKIMFAEYDGLYDITWFTSDYGTESYSLDELPRYIETSPINTQQHCRCEQLDDSECECDYEGQGFSWLIDLLITYPEKIRCLTFTGNDSGANGTRQWNFQRLIDSAVVFTNLEQCRVQLYEVGNHNQIIIGDYTEDHAQVTKLLAKMPNLVDVELPLTPDKEFFKLSFPKLGSIKIQAGNDSLYFIRHLAQSSLLSQITLDFADVYEDADFMYISPENKKIMADTEHKLAEIDLAADSEDALKLMQDEERESLKEAGFSDEEISLTMDNPNRTETLRLLKLTCDSEQEVKDSMAYLESNETWDDNGEAIIYEYEDFEDDYQPSESFQKRTAFEDYKALFESKHIRDGFHFKLRESYLTQDELFALQKSNKKVQFLHIPTHADYYVNHRMQDDNLW